MCAVVGIGVGVAVLTCIFVGSASGSGSCICDLATQPTKRYKSPCNRILGGLMLFCFSLQHPESKRGNLMRFPG